MAGKLTPQQLADIKNRHNTKANTIRRLLEDLLDHLEVVESEQAVREDKIIKIAAREQRFACIDSINNYDDLNPPLKDTTTSLVHNTAAPTTSEVLFLVDEHFRQEFLKSSAF